MSDPTAATVPDSRPSTPGPRRCRTGPVADGRRPVTARLGAWLPAVPALAWWGLFFVAPLVQLAVVSLESPYPGRPGYYVLDVNTGNYASALVQFPGHFGRSVLYAALATVAAFLLALPVAHVAVFRAGRWRGLVLGLVLAPYAVAFLLRTLAWRQLLADDAPVTRALTAVGFAPHGRVTETALAVVAGLAYTYLPFMLVPLVTAFSRLDPRVLEAARDLYAGSWATLVRVTLPLSAPGIGAGVLLTFIPALGDYVTAEMLGSQSDRMAGNAVESQLLRVVGGHPVAGAASMILLAFMLVLVTAYLRRFGARELT